MREKDGQLQVAIDEIINPFRVRTRLLTPGEIGLIKPEDETPSMIRGMLVSSPQLRMLEVGYDTPYRFFQRQGQTFMPGDHVELPDGPAQILILSGETGEAPEVLVRTAPGEARVLAAEDLQQITLDEAHLMKRGAFEDPRPKMTVVRMAGHPPFLVLEDRKVEVGQFVVQGSTLPCTPMKVVEIDDQDRVWIEETVPQGGEDKVGTTEIEGKK